MGCLLTLCHSLTNTFIPVLTAHVTPEYFWEKIIQYNTIVMCVRGHISCSCFHLIYFFYLFFGLRNDSLSHGCVS